MRKCNVVTLCMPEVYDTQPEQNLERAAKLLDSVATLSPDLVCLPELFLQISVNRQVDYNQLADMGLKMLSDKARALKTYIVAGMHEIIDKKKCNVAWLIDREGKLAGRYIKHRPTDYEMDKGTYAGIELPVFETDFGKLGILICFDIDWPELWTQMGKKGAEIVVWPSAYEGGYPLNAYAACNGYYVVSSVRAYKSRIINISGHVLETSSRWANWAYRRIGLDKTLFHIDKQFHKLAQLQQDLGEKITLETFDEENRFTLESNDPDWPMDRIIKAYGLETFKAYHARVEAMNDQFRV